MAPRVRLGISPAKRRMRRQKPSGPDWASPGNRFGERGHPSAGRDPLGQAGPVGERAGAVMAKPGSRTRDFDGREARREAPR